MTYKYGRPYQSARKFAKSYNKAGQTSYQKATQALSIANKVKSQLNVEYKHIDVSSLTTNMTDSGTCLHLTPIAQGDDNTDRNGRCVRAKAIQLRALVEGHVSAATNQTVRVMIFRDNQNQGSTPAVADLLKATVTIGPLELRETDEEQGRFKVYMDKIYNLEPNYSGANPRRIIEFYKSVNHKVYFEGTAAANSGKGTIWMLIISDQATSNYPIIQYNTRVTFVDN